MKGENCNLSICLSLFILIYLSIFISIDYLSSHRYQYLLTIDYIYVFVYTITWIFVFLNSFLILLSFYFFSIKDTLRLKIVTTKSAIWPQGMQNSNLEEFISKSRDLAYLASATSSIKPIIIASFSKQHNAWYIIQILAQNLYSRPKEKKEKSNKSYWIISNLAFDFTQDTLKTLATICGLSVSRPNVLRFHSHTLKTDESINL